MSIDVIVTACYELDERETEIYRNTLEVYGSEAAAKWLSDNFRPVWAECAEEEND